MNVLFRIVPGAHARVGRVTVNGPAGFSVGQIQDIAKMHTGDYVTVQRVSRALDRLRKKYQKQNRLLSQVAISSRTYRPASNTVDYTFDIEPGPKVEIAVEGFKISRSQLKKNVPVYEENALDDDLLNEGRRNLLNYVQGLGYFDAKVTVQKNPVSTGEMRVTYNIDAGERHKLVRLAIAGNKSFSEDLLRSRMQIQPAGRFLAHGRYSQSLLERGCAQPHRQPVSRQRFSGRQDHPQGGRQLSRQGERPGHHAADRGRSTDHGGDLADRGQRNRPDRSVSRSQHFSRTGVCAIPRSTRTAKSF